MECGAIITPNEAVALDTVEAPLDAPADALAGAPADIPADAQVGAPPDMSADVPADAQVGAPPDMSADVPADAQVDAPPDAPADAPPDVPAAQVGAPTDAPADVPADAQVATRMSKKMTDGSPRPDNILLFDATDENLARLAQEQQLCDEDISFADLYGDPGVSDPDADPNADLGAGVGTDDQTLSRLDALADALAALSETTDSMRSDIASELSIIQDNQAQLQEDVQHISQQLAALVKLVSNSQIR